MCHYFWFVSRLRDNWGWNYLVSPKTRPRRRGTTPICSFFFSPSHPPMPSSFLISINLINLSKWNILFYRLWNTGPRRVNRDSLCGDTCYAEMTRYCAPVGWKLCSWVNTGFWLDKIMWESRNTRELRHVLQNKFTLRRSNEQHVQILPPTPPTPKINFRTVKLVPCELNT